MRRRWEEEDMLKKVFQKLPVVLISSVTGVISARSLMLNLKQNVSIYRSIYKHMGAYKKKEIYLENL